MLRKYEPDHLLLEAAWADARARMTDVGRLAHLLDRAADTMLHVDLRPRHPAGGAGADPDRPRDASQPDHADDALLIEAEALAAEAMRLD